MKNIILKSLTISVCSLLLNIEVEAQSVKLINLEKKIAETSINMNNGFSQKIQGEDINYNNLWDGCENAFLTRATNGEKIIEWESENTEIIQNGIARFLMFACVDQANTPCNFDFYINNKLVGTLTNFHESTLKKEFTDGISIEFERVDRSDWGDGAFFMQVNIPETIVKKGDKVVFKLIGQKQESNAWFMIFKHPDLKKVLALRAARDRYTKLTANNKTIEIEVPLDYAQKKVKLSTNDYTKTVPFQAHGGFAMASFPIKELKKGELKVTCENEDLISIDDIENVSSFTTMKGDTLIKVLANMNKGNGEIQVRKSYTPALDNLKHIANSYYKDAKAYIMISSHQDIAWMDSPYKCIEDRDKIIVSPALELLEQHSDYRYDIEDALILEEYITRNPNKRTQIERLIANGQLGIGASYTQPYEEMQSGEALVRQFYYGKRWVEKTFPGANPRTYWNVDVPGRTFQMPQILKKSGVDHLQYSRHERGLFNWYAPDGESYVTTFTPGHYSVASTFLRKSPEEGVDKFIEYTESFNDYRSDKNKPAVIGMLSAEDMSPAHTYYNWIDKFKTYEDTIKGILPTLQHSTSDMFFDAFLSINPILKKVSGERPDLWQYIHGPAHERTLTTYREANRVIGSAETFSTIASLMRGTFENYPKSELDEAWKKIIYPDHGWGGNRGNVTDSLFNACYVTALDIASRLNNEAKEYIASNVNVNSKAGIPIIVFNQLSFVCDLPVRVDMDANVPSLNNLRLINNLGQNVPFQITNEEGKNILEFVANDMPSVGYKTYYLTNAKKSKGENISESFESDFYKLTFDNDKLQQIFDKESEKELFDVSKFEIGEVFCMQSVGNGAGEFSTMQLPTMEDYESTSSNGAKWQNIENGAVYSLFKSESKFNEADIVRYLKLYKGIKRIDFITEVNNFNGRNYREFRQAFPLIGKNEVSYEVPFGTVTVGKDEIKGTAGERYQDEVKDIHPRSIANWIGGKNKDQDVKLSSSVVVADYIDPTDNPVSSTILQQILFASRRSCHWLGEFYSQKGDHKFIFSLRSDAPNENKGAKGAVAANYKAIAIVNPNTFKNANLPENNSFFSLNDEDVVISAIKKSEDDNSITMRLYDALGGENKEITINSFLPVKSIKKVDMIELNPSKIENKIKVGSKAIETVQIDLL